MAGIYYQPFKCGCSLVFAYSGQSIPNRLEVKQDLGVKIYFDAVETQARVEQVKLKVMEVFEDGKGVVESWNPNAVEQLVWHVAAHEVGHAIYGISNVEEFLHKDSVMSLEEPRAELTAMFTLNLLHQQKVVSLPDLEKYLVHFALDGLRYFMKFDSLPLQPYIVFQLHAFNVYNKHGFMVLNGDSKKLQLDASKTLAVLADFSETFEKVLDLCDLGGVEGGKGLEELLVKLRHESEFTQSVVEMCKPSQ